MGKPKKKIVGLSGSAKGLAVRVKGSAAQPTVSVPEFAMPGKSNGNENLVLNYVANANWQRLYLPWIPDEIQHDSIARVWEQVPRPGRTPLMFNTGGQLPTINMTVMLKRTDDSSVQPVADALRILAADGTAVIATLGQRNLGNCQITGLSIRETDWDANGYTTEAEADLELTAYVAASLQIGPVPPSASKTIAKGTARGVARRGRR